MTVRSEFPKTETQTNNGEPLVEIVIRREGHRWTVIRRRAKNGETLGCDSLEECFESIRQAYDTHGQPLPWPKRLVQIETPAPTNPAIRRRIDERGRKPGGSAQPGTTPQPSSEREGSDDV